MLAYRRCDSVEDHWRRALARLIPAFIINRVSHVARATIV